MRHRGVKIVTVKWLDRIDIGRREDSAVKAIWKTGYAPVGVSYPMTLEEAKASVDSLIEKTIWCCQVTEKEAAKLLNEC